MSPRTLIIGAAIALATFVGSQPAQAQDRYDFMVPFNFTAAGKNFTAGQYSLVVNANQETVSLEPANVKGSGVLLPVETRISERQQLAEPELVFDKTGTQSALSELLIPGGDGYLLLATKGKHTHVSVKGSRLKK